MIGPQPVDRWSPKTYLRVFTLNDVLNPAKTQEIALKPGEIVFVSKQGLARAIYLLQRLNPLFQSSSFDSPGAVL
jgi:hypothetical protein